VIAEMLCKVFVRLELAELLMALEQMRMRCFPSDISHGRGMRWIGSSVGRNQLK